MIVILNDRAPRSPPSAPAGGGHTGDVLLAMIRPAAEHAALHHRDAIARADLVVFPVYEETGHRLDAGYYVVKDRYENRAGTIIHDLEDLVNWS